MKLRDLVFWNTLLIALAFVIIEFKCQTEKVEAKPDFEAEYFSLLDRISELLKKNNPSLSGSHFIVFLRLPFKILFWKREKLKSAWKPLRLRRWVKRQHGSILRISLQEWREIHNTCSNSLSQSLELRVLLQMTSLVILCLRFLFIYY